MKENREKINPKAQNHAEQTQNNVEIIQRDSVSVQLESAKIEWEAPDYEYNPKEVSWYWLSLILSIVLIAFAIWQGNFLFAIFVVIAWFAVISFANRYPANWKFNLDYKGVSMHLVGGESEQEKFYSYSEMDGFDIHEASDEHKELVIKIKSRFSPFLRVNFPHIHEERIVMVFTKFVPKEEYEDSLADHLFKLIRF